MLEFESCSYRYRRWRSPVLRSFNYQVPQGLTMLLGPNGAGKSTILKLAAGTIRPSAGTIKFDGAVAGTREYSRNIGWMPQNITPISSLTVREYVAYVGWLKGMNRREAWDRAANALGRVELTELSGRNTTQISGGQLRRVGVAATLVHDVKLLLLDEPTAGLDPQQRRVFRDLLHRLANDLLVLISTHDVMDLAEEADRVTVVNRGEVLHDGATSSFLEHAPDDASPGRVAEAAYTAILNDADMFPRVNR